MYKTKSIYTQVALSSIMENFAKEEKILSIPDELKVKAACFVTLHKINGELRGCIGTLEPFRENLYEEIWGNAKSAAYDDPRFPPLREYELEEIEISVDVLEKAEKIDKIEKLDPKIYGVIVSSRGRRGVLLPDIEGVDSPEKQVSIAREKGGILPGENADIYRFQVKRYH
ncbi:AmmeMemoRadiSam system protein A [Ilyobacter polytropus]|uniref:AMMECR1 domain protein n=1 Tax=Ilyobacter polytropus (strain ATCC 51220 / DSM 2926 / LMG 16218 / CuHBu1) TaxID=572544 RepID=E3H5Y4_ILYPC|nr:AmmeMemoRadiSam system protein A [Ilyobacter polytropus]ADO82274.1 AMMECR1 domain protein [Ilyobacter polytropus DSM 2926]